MLHYGSNYSKLYYDFENSLQVSRCVFANNTADYGQAVAMEALSIHERRFYNGIQFIATTIHYGSMYFNDLLLQTQREWKRVFMKNNKTFLREIQFQMVKKLHRGYNPDEEVQIMSSGKGLVYMKATTFQVDQHLFVACGGSSQGIVAVNAEIHIESGSDFRVLDCVASHGGGVALLGESYIQISDDVHLEFENNHAFNRGGAIYADFVQLQAKPFSCFLQYNEFPVLAEDWWDVNITFINNWARLEGHSIYVTDIKACLQSRLTNGLEEYSTRNNTVNHIFASSPPFCFIPAGCTSICEQGTNESHCSIHGEVVSMPSQVTGSSSMLRQTRTFIPGKETSPLFETVKDDIGNVVSAVFTVQIIPKDSAIKVNPFSKFTSDFRVILHGSPLNQTSIPLTNSSKLHEVSTLILQSVDNSNLLTLVGIEMQCCPPGYMHLCCQWSTRTTGVQTGHLPSSS